MNQVPSLNGSHSDRTRPVVLQIGPAPGSSGGIASVIEETLKFESKKFEQRACPSWTPNGRLASFPRALRTGFTMSTRMRHWSIAHVHLSEYGSFIREGSLLLLARALRRPAVATLHGANLPEHVTKYPRLTRTIFDAASIVLCLGETQAAIVARISPKASVRVIANPVDDAVFHRVSAPPRHHGQPRFVYAGEVGHRKGHDRLISAWATVLEKHPGAQLRIAGPIAKGYKVVPQPGAEYLGNLSRTALLDEFSNATATVLPSRAEVLPMVLIESHAQGTPAVYTKVGEWQVFADAPGIRLVDTEGHSEDAIIASIADAMIDLAATETNRIPLISWTCDRFSVKVVSDQLDDAYRNAIVDTDRPGHLANEETDYEMSTSRKTKIIHMHESTEEW